MIEGMTTLSELWLSKNLLDEPQFLTLLQLTSCQHFMGGSNPWCSNKYYNELILSAMQNCRTLDGAHIREHDLDSARAFMASSTGKGVYHKLKFDKIQASNLKFIENKISAKTHQGRNGSPVPSNGREKWAGKNINGNALRRNDDLDNNSNSNNHGGAKALRLRIKDASKYRQTSQSARSPSRYSSPKSKSPLSPKPKPPKSPPGVTLATASISDCMSLLPSFDKGKEAEEKMKREEQAKKRAANSRRRAYKPARCGSSFSAHVQREQAGMWADQGGNGLNM